MSPPRPRRHDPDRRDFVITRELRTLAARRPELRDITTAWMTRTRAALAPSVEETCAVLLDAMDEGLSIHRALHQRSPRPGPARGAVARGVRPAP